MVAQAVADVESAQRGDEQRAAQERGWHPVTRVAFRFGFVCLGLGLAAQWLVIALLGTLFVPVDAIAAVQKWWQLYPLTDWFADVVFGIEQLNYTGTGSGDTQVFWVSAFTWLIVAAVATAVWSVLDRRRPGYPRLFEWFRLLLRFALAMSLVLYGTVKVMPSQMPFELQRLIEPFGDMSPMGALWSTTAAAEPYEIALGAAELAAAVLLLVPFTAIAGGLLAVVVTMQVFLLNLTYDVPVKLYSGQLFVFALVLVAPDAVRITRVLLGSSARAATRRPLLGTVRGSRIALAVYALLAVWLVGNQIEDSWNSWTGYGNGREKSPLYGIWTVSEYTVSTVQLPPLVVDGAPPRAPGDLTIGTERLRRVVFDSTYAVTVQRMDDSLVQYPARIDTENRTIALTADSAGRWKVGDFRYEEAEDGTLALEGQLSGRSVRMRLQQVDLDRYPLVSRGFHWVQDAPYKR